MFLYIKEIFFATTGCFISYFMYLKSSVNLPPSRCSPNVNEYDDPTKLCKNTWQQCLINIDVSMFYGKVSLTSPQNGNSLNRKMINKNTVGTFSCDVGWKLHLNIKEYSTAYNTDAHGIICKKHGWFVLKNDG